MITTPEEKRKLAELLQNMQVSGSYDYAHYANEYYTLVNNIRTRDPRSILTPEETRAYGARVRELEGAHMTGESAREIALKEILQRRQPS